MKAAIRAFYLGAAVTIAAFLPVANAQAPQPGAWPPTFKTSWNTIGQLVVHDETFAAYVAPGLVSVVHAIGPADRVLQQSPSDDDRAKGGSIEIRLSDHEKQLIRKLADAVDAAAASSYAQSDARARGSRSMTVHHHVLGFERKNDSNQVLPICVVRVSGQKEATGKTAWNLDRVYTGPDCYSSYQAAGDAALAKEVAEKSWAASERAKALEAKRASVQRCQSAFENASDQESYKAALSACSVSVDISERNSEREADSIIHYYRGLIEENGYTDGKTKPKAAKWQYTYCATVSSRCAEAVTRTMATIAQITRRAIAAGDSASQRGDSELAERNYNIALSYGDITSGPKLIALIRAKWSKNENHRDDLIYGVYKQMAGNGSDEALNILKVEYDKRKAHNEEVYADQREFCRTRTFTETRRTNGTVIGLPIWQQREFCLQEVGQGRQRQIRSFDEVFDDIASFRRGDSSYPDNHWDIK
jgi:hypothetical protein